MRKTLCVAALLLAVCCPAHAGEIPNPPVPVPIVTGGEYTTPDPGSDPTAPDEGTDTGANALIEVVFALLPSLLS